MFNSILAQRITKHCTKWKVLNDQQDGFMPGRGTMGHAMALSEIVTNMLNNNETPYACFVDLAKAFDCIPREHVRKNLTKAGIPDHLVSLICDMHDKTKARFRVNNELTNYIDTIQGVPQGDPLSPILFNIVIDPMLRELEDKGIGYKFIHKDKESHVFMMYADDFVILMRLMRI